MGTIVRNLPKNPISAPKLRILSQLGSQGLIPQGLDRKVLLLDSELDFWHPPCEGFLKSNIDGASKANLGTTDHGGVLRDENGSILLIFYCHLERDTNNMEELMAIE